MTIDLTGVAATVFGGILSIAGTLFLAWLQGHMKDKQAAAVLGDAVRNALGAMQQAATAGIRQMAPGITAPVSPVTAAGIQYVLDNAGDEAARLGIGQDAIAAKIAAQLGLQSIATNIAVAGSTSPVVPDPIGPVPKAA